MWPRWRGVHCCPRSANHAVIGGLRLGSDPGDVYLDLAQKLVRTEGPGTS